MFSRVFLFILAAYNFANQQQASTSNKNPVGKSHHKGTKTQKRLGGVIHPASKENRCVSL